MTKDPVSQKVTDQLPSQLPGREAVRELLLSLKVPNSALVPAICSRLLSIGREAPWLFERGTSVPGFEIRRGLGELAALDRRRLDFRGRTELFPRAATLATQYPIPPPAHERLRGLFVLGWLLKRHVTVASDAEIRLLISQADRDFGQTADTIDKATIAITLLHIATGRALPSLMDTHIHPHQAENPEQQHLYLDIEAGTLTSPLLQNGFAA